MENNQTEKIYTVTFFNYIANDDNIVYVKAKNEFDAALLAHASTWIPAKPFDIDEYHVLEFDNDYITTRESILNKQNPSWTDDLLDKVKLDSCKQWIKDNYIYYKGNIEELKSDLSEKSGLTFTDEEIKKIIDKQEDK